MFRHGVLLGTFDPFPDRRSAVRIASSAEFTLGCSSGRLVENRNHVTATITARMPETRNDERQPHRCMVAANNAGAMTPPAPTPPSNRLLPIPRSFLVVQNATILLAFG